MISRWIFEQYADGDAVIALIARVSFIVGLLLMAFMVITERRYHSDAAEIWTGGIIGLFAGFALTFIGWFVVPAIVAASFWMVFL
jgi:hypothetical protein